MVCPQIYYWSKNVLIGVIIVDLSWKDSIAANALVLQTGDREFESLSFHQPKSRRNVKWLKEQ